MKFNLYLNREPLPDAVRPGDVLPGVQIAPVGEWPHGETLGPMSAHMKGITDGWLKKQDLTVTNDGKVFNTRSDNSATGQVDSKDVSAEGNSSKNADIIAQSVAEVNPTRTAPETPAQREAMRHSVFVGSKAADRVGQGATLRDAERMLREDFSGAYTDKARDEIYAWTGWWKGVAFRVFDWCD